MLYIRISLIDRQRCSVQSYKFTALLNKALLSLFAHVSHACEMGGSHSAVGEDSTLVGRDFVVYPEDAVSKLFRNVCNNFQSTRPHISKNFVFFLPVFVLLMIT